MSVFPHRWKCLDSSHWNRRSSLCTRRSSSILFSASRLNLQAQAELFLWTCSHKHGTSTMIAHNVLNFFLWGESLYGSMHATAIIFLKKAQVNSDKERKRDNTTQLILVISCTIKKARLWTTKVVSKQFAVHLYYVNLISTWGLTLWTPNRTQTYTDQRNRFYLHFESFAPFASATEPDLAAMETTANLWPKLVNSAVNSWDFSRVALATRESDEPKQQLQHMVEQGNYRNYPILEFYRNWTYCPPHFLKNTGKIPINNSASQQRNASCQSYGTLEPQGGGRGWWRRRRRRLITGTLQYARKQPAEGWKSRVEERRSLYVGFSKNLSLTSPCCDSVESIHGRTPPQPPPDAPAVSAAVVAPAAGVGSEGDAAARLLGRVPSITVLQSWPV